MCGIAGIIDFRRGPSAAILEAMGHALRHRGPDAAGTWIHGPCGLAHARLSIIDLSGSPQPMVLPDGAAALTYNGELYNYGALRNSLIAQGVQPRTKGDTEVLLHLVAQGWERRLPELDGMFAFAAWRTRDETLLLARDPFGKKPLFWCEFGEGLLFASEIKAILAHPEAPVDLDADSLREVARFRAVYGHRSLYKGIQQVPPGSWVEFSRRGIRAGSFYSLRDEVMREPMDHGNQARTVAEFGRRLQSSVQKRLIADVPVGAFLSGGLDSSVLVAEMKRGRAAGAALRTYSVGFDGDPNSELPFATLVAQRLGTTHTDVVVRPEEYAENLIGLTDCRDAPLSEPADVAIGIMSAVAARDVKVVLSGEAADEVFCGYPKYAYAAVPSWGRALAGAFGPRRITSACAWLGVDPRRARVAARALCQPDQLDSYVQWFSYLERSELRSLLPGLGWSDDEFARTTSRQREAFRAKGEGWGDPLRAMQAVDCLAWLPANLLERGDRMTMSAGLELRLPFLDKQLVPFGIALARRYKVRRGRGKWIIRQWARDQVPQEILARKKSGFKVPLAQWFRGPLRPMLNDYLTAKQSLSETFGDAARVRALIDEHQTGQRDRYLELWTLLAMEVWYQHSFRGRQPRSEVGRVELPGVPVAASL